MAKLGELLVSRGACSGEAVAQALENQASFGSRLGTNLIQLGAVRESQVADALGSLHDVPSVSGDVPADPGAVALLDRRLAEKYQVVPFLVSERKLALLVRDPRDFRALDELAFLTGRTIHPFAVPEVRLWAMMRKVYGVERQAGSRAIDLVEGAAPMIPAPSPVAAAPVELALAADLIDEEQFLAVYQR